MTCVPLCLDQSCQAPSQVCSIHSDHCSHLDYVDIVCILVTTRLYTYIYILVIRHPLGKQGAVVLSQVSL